MARDLHVLLHVPKTGGQTLREHLRSHLAFHTEYVHLGPFGESRAQYENLPPWEERSEEERAKVRVLHGHNLTRATEALVPGERTIKRCVVLREPGARMVSNYNHNVEHKWVPQGRGAPSWDEWYEGHNSKPRNFCANWIKTRYLQDERVLSDVQLFDLVFELLRGFWRVGATERLDDFSKALCGDLGIPAPANGARVNAAGKDYPVRQTPTPEIVAQVRADHPVDAELYDWFAAY